MKKNYIYEACLNTLQDKLSPNIFINEVLIQCINSNQISDLHESILKIDPDFKKSWSYLNQACKYLSENNYNDFLYQFQIFMQDYSKATYRCLNMFAESTCISKKLKYLEQAEQHCVQALVKPPKIVFTNYRNDMREQMNSIKRLIQLQKQLLVDYPQFNNFHLFAPNEKIILFVKQLMIVDEDLTFKIITHFKLLDIQCF